MTIAREATQQTTCPLCGHDHYCFLIGNPIQKVVCQFTDENKPPTGWDYIGQAKDGRPMFSTGQRRRKNKTFPQTIELNPSPERQAAYLAGHPTYQQVEPEGSLEVGEIITHNTQHYLVTGRTGRKTGGKQTLFLKVKPTTGGAEWEVPQQDCQLTVTDSDAQLQQIEYLYPDPITQEPLGKVVRRQWSDRRAWFEKLSKTKEIRPYYWHADTQSWKLGLGDRSWPLYRENEAKEAILNGGIVFAVGGEQAVEHYRALGLTATCPQGGEAKFRAIIDRLEDAFYHAQKADKQPLIVSHPDFDLTGEKTYGAGLQTHSKLKRIPVITLNPLEVWPNLKNGQDIADIRTQSGLSDSQIVTALETAIDSAINEAEKAEQLIQQRDRWGAPDTYQGELGYWSTNQQTQESFFTPLTNFDFMVEKEVASTDGGGFILQLKRAGEYRQYRVFLPSLDFTSVQQFENTLKKALGGVLICRLSTNQMKALLRVRLHEYTHNRGGKVYRLVERVGQQPDGHWIFDRLQLTPKGEPTDEQKSLWIWNRQLTGDESTLPKPAISPPSDTAIPNLLAAMETFFGANLFPALITLGYGAAAIHYQEIVEKDGAFPILNLIGDGGSGKTTAAMCALSLCGMHTEASGGILREASISAAYEHLKITGSLLHCLDDPERTPALDEFLKGLYNGKARLVRGSNGAAFNMQRPHSPLMVTSNFACGETNAATMSRLIQIWFDANQKGDLKTYTQLSQAWDKASGQLAQLIGMGYPQAEVKAIEDLLIPHLPHANSRIARSIALVVYYAEAVCRLAGRDFDVLGYAISTLCAMANDIENSTDSLRDFIEKLFILRSQAKLGEWNLRFINEYNSDRIKSLAINIQSAWVTIDSSFKLAYNLRIIKHLLQGRGAAMSARQRFHMDEDVSKAFQRGTTDNPHWQTKRCVEIPVDLIRHYVDIDLETVNRVSTASTGQLEITETPTPQADELLTPICQQTVNRYKNCQQTLEEPQKVHSDTKQPVDNSLLTADHPVDSKVSTAETPTPQALEPSQGGSVDAVDIEMCPNKMAQRENAGSSDHPFRLSVITPTSAQLLPNGSRVEILSGRFTGKLGQVEGMEGDLYLVRGDGWAVSRPYSEDDLWLISPGGDDATP